MFRALIFVSLILAGSQLFAGLHKAPIVISGSLIRASTGFGVELYRLYKTGSGGVAQSIPFQIDEINEYSDYILGQGPVKDRQDGIFDIRDELSFMGEDVGAKQVPSIWPSGRKPDFLFEIEIKQEGPGGTPRLGAVYLAIFNRSFLPTLSPKRYVIFSPGEGRFVPAGIATALIRRII